MVVYWFAGQVWKGVHSMVWCSREQWHHGSYFLKFCTLHILKGRMKLPLKLDRQWLRTVANYSEDVVKRPLNPSRHPSRRPSMDVGMKWKLSIHLSVPPSIQTEQIYFFKREKTRRKRKKNTLTIRNLF
jgi:hypothetical protein